MIKKIDNTTMAELLSFLREQPVLNIYGLSYAEGYPLDDRFYKAYKCDSGYIIVLDNIAFVYADLDDEIYAFFDYFGIEYIYSFSKPNENFISETAVIMSIGTVIPQNKSCASEASDKEMYDLLCNSFEYMPEFENYKNTRIEQRHYLGSFSANIFIDNMLVSTAAVGMQNSLSGLISCVATNTDYRGIGLGSSVVASVSNDLLDQNKIPVIISDEERVIKLYKKLGFCIASELYISTKKAEIHNC